MEQENKTSAWWRQGALATVNKLQGEGREGGTTNTNKIDIEKKEGNYPICQIKPIR